MNLLIEFGLLAALAGAPTDSHKVQDVQKPYFLVEKSISNDFVARFYSENVVNRWQTLESTFQAEIKRNGEGFNYGIGYQSENETGNTASRSGGTVYLRLSYRFEQ